MGFGYTLGKFLGRALVLPQGGKKLSAASPRTTRKERLPSFPVAPLALDSEGLSKLFAVDGGFEYHEAAAKARAKAGCVDGEHYTALVPAIKEALKAKDFDSAAGLLLRAVEGVEREAMHPVRHAAPRWFHERLAAVYKKLGRADLEVVVRRKLAALTTDFEQRR